MHVAPESLSVAIPAAALTSDRPTAASAPLVLRGTRARLRGALLEAADEATVRAPGVSRVVIELRGDMWVDDLDATPCDLDLCSSPPPPPSPSAPPSAPPSLPPSPPANFSVEPNFTNVTVFVPGAAMITPRACTAGSALLAGIQSPTFHPTGWNRYVQPQLQLQRYDNLTIVVGVPQVLPPRRTRAPHPRRTRAAPAPRPSLTHPPPLPPSRTLATPVVQVESYDVVDAETIHLTIPACALRDANRNVSVDSFVVTPVAPRAALSGPLLSPNLTEASLRSGMLTPGEPLSLLITLRDAEWQPTLVENATLLAPLLRGLRPVPNPEAMGAAGGGLNPEASGWEEVVLPQLLATPPEQANPSPNSSPNP